MLNIQPIERPFIAKMEPLLVDAPTAAKLLAIGERTLWRLTDEGSISRIRIRRSVRYAVTDLLLFAQNRNSVDHKCLTNEVPGNEIQIEENQSVTVLEPILVDSKTAAKLLAIGGRTLWRLANEGVLPAVKRGATVRYAVADLKLFISRARVRVPAAGRENQTGGDTNATARSA